VSDRSAPQKHVWRANIILATADGCGTAEIMRRSARSKPVVWRWQARFMAEGVEGLTRDKTRKPGKPPLPAGTVQKVVDLALGPPRGETTHWTRRMSPKAAGVTYYVALPFVASDDGVAAGEPTECFNPVAVVMRAEALSRKEGQHRRGRIQPHR
jgi:hypothetical protein